MKKVLVLLFLVTVAFAVDTRIHNVLAPIEDKPFSAPSLRISREDAPPSENFPIIGRMEVIGYTFYDWQINGPSYSWAMLDPVANGIHISYMYQLGSDARNTRYNFYDFGTNSWNWPGTGVNAYSISTGFGGMACDPITGNAVISAHGGSPLLPQVARDISPGTGLFEYTVPTITSLWPSVAVTQNQMIHIAAINNDAGALRDTCYYHRMTAWNTWSPQIVIHQGNAVPYFPTQNIAASRTANKVCIGWHCSEDPYPERMFYRTSTDAGATWGAQTQVPFPPSYGGIVPGYGITSFFAMYDNSGNLRIVTSVADTGYTIPAQIWMYSPHLSSPWTLIHHYTAETLAAAVGYNAIFACRPTVAQATNGNFYVAWEQFDSLNYEPTTSLARADIYVAELTNNGQTVSRKGRITDPNTTSKRFPAVAGVKNDSILVRYLIDSVAGFFNYQQGATTNNPVVLHRLHVNSLPLAIEEQIPSNPINLSLSATPNPFHGNTHISYSIPKTTNVDLTIYDILGRPVKTLVSGNTTAGVYTTNWNGRTNSNELAQAGVYFFTLKTGEGQIARKIIKSY